MKFAVLVFPGSNCDRDMYNAAIKSGAQADYVDYRETSLEGYDGVLIPGGFSFGDYLRSGCGIIPQTLPALFTIPAIFSWEPFGLSSYVKIIWLFSTNSLYMSSVQ